MEEAMEGWSDQKSADGCMHSRGGQRQGWKSSDPQTRLDSTFFRHVIRAWKKKGVHYMDPVLGPSVQISHKVGPNNGTHFFTVSADS
jgi:hypothetical protein